MGESVSFLQDITIFSIALRLILSLLLGGIIGMERGAKGRPAGIRTYMLVSIGATLIMITNQYIVEIYKSGDPARLGAQVVNGIGFLGAGTIMVTGKNRIEGLTTAAGLWASASVGLAIGIGFYSGAILGALTIYTVMAVMHEFSRKVGKPYQKMRVYIELSTMRDLGHFLEYIHYHHIKIVDLEIVPREESGATSAILFSLSLDTKMTLFQAEAILKNTKLVRMVQVYA